MRSALLLFTGLTLAAGSPAYAADSLPPSGYDWTGFYVGIQGGGGAGDSDIAGAGFLVSDEPEGWHIGGHASYLWQFDRLVAGLEVEASYSEIDVESEPAPGNVFSTSIDAFGSLSGKLGMAFDRLLVYGTGGVAFADISTGQVLPGTGSFELSETYVGWTAGVGIDFAATDAIVVGLQYRYYDFGDEDFDTPPGFLDRSQDVDLHTVLGKVSYRF